MNWRYSIYSVFRSFLGNNVSKTRVHAGALSEFIHSTSDLHRLYDDA